MHSIVRRMRTAINLPETALNLIARAWCKPESQECDPNERRSLCPQPDRPSRLWAVARVDRPPFFVALLWRHDRAAERGGVSASPHVRWAPLGRRSPMVRAIPVVRLSNSRDQRRVALAFGPINRLALRLECAERASGLIFDNEIRDWGPFAIALRAGLNVNVRQFRSPNFASTRPPRIFVNGPTRARGPLL
jgi:hypothetical protein